MNTASSRFAPLWKLAWREGLVLWLSLAGLMFGFHWLYVWMTSQFDANFLSSVLDSLPDFYKKILPVEVAQMLKPEGRLAVAYDHPLIVFGCAAWAITRGSDAVCGPLGRGTLEMILAQPVSRSKVLLANGLSTTLGLVGLTSLGWLGGWFGIQTVPTFADVPAGPFAFAALNLFCLAFFIAGLTTLLSAADRHRWRTIGLMIGLFVLAMLFKVIGRGVPDLSWLQHLSFLSWYEPQKLIQSGSGIVDFSLRMDGPLLAFGLAAYVGAAVVFSKRDLPAPL